MDKEERFLPIGTVVLLKGGKRELMITSYCIVPTGDVYDKTGKIENAGKMFDYGACFYPEGMVTSDQLFAFNHEQVDRVCFKGYETDNQKDLSKMLNTRLEEIKNALESSVKSEEKEDQTEE
jgi:hypothetical protein